MHITVCLCAAQGKFNVIVTCNFFISLYSKSGHATGAFHLLPFISYYNYFTIYATSCHLLQFFFFSLFY